MKADKKYKLTNETIFVYGITLYRIEALKDFDSIKKGEKGGFVESEYNLSQNGNCWIYDDAKVYGYAKVFGDAQVYGNASIYGNARVGGNAEVCYNAKVYDNAMVERDAEVYGFAEIRGNAKVLSCSDYIVFKNWWSSGRYFTWTRSNNMWSVGCFYGTGEELITKAYKDSKLSGREYERVVKYVESILKDEKL